MLLYLSVCFNDMTYPTLIFKDLIPLLILKRCIASVLHVPLLEYNCGLCSREKKREKDREELWRRLDKLEVNNRNKMIKNS